MPFSPSHRILVMGAAFAVATGAQAQDIVYTPVNPSFGGSPANTTHLFAAANAQRTATIGSSSTSSSSGASGSSTSTTAGTGATNDEFDQFVRQLQSRLLSALSSQVTQAIFGDNAQDSGTITFGDQQVRFERTLTSIRLTIDDFGAGTSTVIEVPQLVIN